MAYTSTNFKTKKQFKEAVANGKTITVFNMSPFGMSVPDTGTVCIEGPQYPEPHRWYATATLENGVVVRVK